MNPRSLAALAGLNATLNATCTSIEENSAKARKIFADVDLNMHKAQRTIAQCTADFQRAAEVFGRSSIFVSKG